MKIFTIFNTDTFSVNLDGINTNNYNNTMKTREIGGSVT